MVAVKIAKMQAVRYGVPSDQVPCSFFCWLIRISMDRKSSIEAVTITGREIVMR